MVSYCCCYCCNALISVISHIVPSTRRTTLGDRAFPVAAARAWNDLPPTIMASPSLLTFRQQTKTSLFRSTFHWTAHTRLTALCLGLPRWDGTRKAKPIWILLKQETVSGSGISWAVCKSAHRCRQTTTPAPHHSVFASRMPFLPPNQKRQSTEGTELITTDYSELNWLYEVPLQRC